MPFTLAHPAAVLPLRRLGLPVTALVLGSMAPDVPIFAGSRGYLLTHSLRGILVVDPVLAAVACVVWFAVVRDALVDLAPGPIRHRLAPHVRLSVRQWLLVPVAAATGAATHVAWDAFTHGGRWGVDLLPLLDQRYGPFPGYAWAQYLSGVLGLAVLTVTASVHLARQPATPRARRTSAGLGWLLGGALGIAGLAGLVAAATAPGGRIDMLYAAVVSGLVVLGVAGGLVCLLWRALADQSAA